MLQMQLETMKDLEVLIREEISIYKSLLLLETNKRDSIIHSQGKELESATKQINLLLTRATETEKARQECIQKLFEERHFSQKQDTIILSELLENLREEELANFQALAEELKSVVGALREKVLINEKLLKAKQEIFQLSMEAMRVASSGPQDTSYEAPVSKGSRARTSIMINAKA